MTSLLVCFDIDGVLLQAPTDSYDWRREMPGPDALALYTDFENDDPLWLAALRGETRIHDALLERAKERGLSHDLFLDTLRIWHGRNTVFNHSSLALLRETKLKGHGVAIASNQDRDRAAVLRRILFLDDFVDHWFFSSEAGAMKPDRAFYAHIEAQSPADAYAFIDDVPANLVEPGKMGWRTHLYTDTAALRAFLSGF